MNLIFNSEKKIGLFILTSAVIVAGILAFYDPQASKKSLADLQKEGGADAEGFNIEKDGQKLGENLDILGIINNDVVDEDNLTKKITNEISQKIISLNQENDLSGGKITVPNESIFTEEMINKYKSDFFNSNQKVGTKDFKTIQDNLPRTTLEYFQKLLIIIRDNNIAEERIGGLLNEFLQLENAGYLKQPIEGMNNAILDLKNIVVPNSWLTLHSDFVNLLINKRDFYQALYNQKNDPMKAVIALQLIDELDNNFNQWYIAADDKLEQDGAFVF
jgi:hypothetical protein